MNIKKIYCIVANSDFNINRVKLRRHRLVKHLLEKNDTELVIWIYPIKNKVFRLDTFKDFFFEPTLVEKGEHDKLIKIGIHDSIPDFLIPKYFLSSNNLIYRKSVDKLLKILDNYSEKKILYYTYPCFPFLTKTINWNTILYDCSDLWTNTTKENPGFLSELSLYTKSRDEKKIIQDSHLLFATSDFLKKEISNKTQKNITVVENGVDYEIFNRKNLKKNHILDEVPHPRFGFVGGMKSKIDFLRLEKLAISNPEWHIILIGPSISKIQQLYGKILSQKNVYAYNSIKPEKVPEYLNYLDVGLLPYKNLKYNKAVFPLKLFEYLAAELPVVGWGVPSTKKYSSKGVYYYADKIDTIDEINELCKNALVLSKDIEYQKLRKSLAKSKNWDQKFDMIIKNINQHIS